MTAVGVPDGKNRRGARRGRYCPISYDRDVRSRTRVARRGTAHNRPNGAPIPAAVLSGQSAAMGTARRRVGGGTSRAERCEEASGRHARCAGAHQLLEFRARALRTLGPLVRSDQRFKFMPAVGAAKIEERHPGIRRRRCRAGRHSSVAYPWRGGGSPVRAPGEPAPRPPSSGPPLSASRRTNPVRQRPRRRRFRAPANWR